MTANPYLAHLISDPTYGYLFPHRLALAAFGVPNDYHLRKHYPRLVDGQHYLKIRGSDNVERLFYTLIGLLTLSDLVNTPQAQAFKQALIAHTQPPGEIVPSPSTPIAPNQPQTPSPLATAQSAATTVLQNDRPFSPSPIAPPSVDPAALVAQYLQPEIERVIERSLFSQSPGSASSTYPSPQDTAALIFEAQRLATEHAQHTAQTLLNAQRLIHEQSPSEVHINVNLWKRWDDWLAQQDTWAMTLIATAIFALFGIGAYCLVAVTVRPTSLPQSTPNSQPVEVRP
jgi:hypothetical protein